MAIKKLVKVPSVNTTVDAFISGAPDAVIAKTVGVIRGKKQIITIGFTPEALERIDVAGTNVGISRAAWINLACSKALIGE